jgi:GxxExxY protein
MTKRDLNSLGFEIVACAIKVHNELGPGLLESIYEQCLVYELKKHGLQTKSQQVIPLKYDGLNLETNLRLDILVNDLIVVELKAVDSISNVHMAQIISYMKLLEKPKGMIINFQTDKIVDSTMHFANQLFWELPS